MASLAHEREERPRPRERHRKERSGAPVAAATSSRATGSSGLVVSSTFANELPLPPVPKLLRALPSCRRFSKYSANSMELDDRPWVLLERDPEARIDLVNVSKFGTLPAIGSMCPPLKKEDQQLVSDYDLSETLVEAAKKRRRLTEETEAFHREAFGLQLPQLLTNDVFTERQRYTTGDESTEKKLHRDPPVRLNDEELCVKVENTFADAAKEPVHPSNPALKARRTLPIVPDAFVWGNKYRQVVFDELPESPKRQDLLYMSIPSPRITCFGYFSSPSEDVYGGNTYRLAQNYVWENRGAYSRQIAINEGEALLMSFPEDAQEDGEVRFVTVPPWIKLKKQKAFKLDLELPTQILSVSHREPSAKEAEEEHARMGVVLRDEVGHATETSDVAWVNGQWVVQSARESSKDQSSFHPTPPASPSEAPATPQDLPATPQQDS